VHYKLFEIFDRLDVEGRDVKDMTPVEKIRTSFHGAPSGTGCVYLEDKENKGKYIIILFDRIVNPIITKQSIIIKGDEHGISYFPNLNHNHICVDDKNIEKLLNIGYSEESKDPEDRNVFILRNKDCYDINHTGLIGIGDLEDTIGYEEMDSGWMIGYFRVPIKMIKDTPLTRFLFKNNIDNVVTFLSKEGGLVNLPIKLLKEKYICLQNKKYIVNILEVGEYTTAPHFEIDFLQSHLDYKAVYGVRDN